MHGETKINRLIDCLLVYEQHLASALASLATFVKIYKKKKSFCFTTIKLTRHAVLVPPFWELVG